MSHLGDINHVSWPRDLTRQALRKCRWSITYYGLNLTLCGSVVRLLARGPGSQTLVNWYKNAISRAFDRRFQVDTAGYVPVEELEVPPEQTRGAIHYQPTAAATFGVVLSELRINHRDYVFVDYGSGKGRTLVQAAHFPFKEIVGVEFSPPLHRIAEANIVRLASIRLRCRRIRSVCRDAATFEPPAEPLVLYFFHPFTEPVLDAALQTVRRSLERSPRHVILVYQGPACRDDVTQGGAVAARVVGSRLWEVFARTEWLRPCRLRFRDHRWAVYENVWPLPRLTGHLTSVSGQV